VRETGYETEIAERWIPVLTVVETTRGCRLVLEGHSQGEGATLQEAADDLIAFLLRIALAGRATSFRIPAELGQPDLRWFEFVHELGEIAAAGGDIRDRVFGGKLVEPA
jgi:hypothetical protein